MEGDRIWSWIYFLIYDRIYVNSRKCSVLKRAIWLWLWLCFLLLGRMKGRVDVRSVFISVFNIQCKASGSFCALNLKSILRMVSALIRFIGISLYSSALF